MRKNNENIFDTLLCTAMNVFSWKCNTINYVSFLEINHLDDFIVYIDMPHAMFVFYRTQTIIICCIFVTNVVD